MRKEAVEQMPCGQVNGNPHAGTCGSVTRYRLQKNSAAKHFPCCIVPNLR